ncbi:hypothetical protein ACFE04_015818 [Oxalis oulophora]
MDKRIPTINLSLFTNFSSNPSTKSPRNFENGVVGLGIVAAMTSDDEEEEVTILSCAKATANFKSVMSLNLNNTSSNNKVDDRMDLDNDDDDDEGYTCVISRVNDNLINKRVYFGEKVNDYYGGFFDVSVVVGGCEHVMMMNGEDGVLSGQQGFLNSCDRCKKSLHGLDIFMYRGEYAFCSLECREKHIRNDGQEKCGTEARKSLECSASPCSSPLTFFAGVAAA